MLSLLRLARAAAEGSEARDLRGEWAAKMTWPVTLSDSEKYKNSLRKDS
jgi:hypothetical protein